MRRIITHREQQQMRRPWLTAAPFRPTNPERFKWMMDRRWDNEKSSPDQLRQRHLDQISDDPDAQAEWESRPDDDEFSGPEYLPQDTLPGMGDVQGTDGRLLRGLPIDTTNPNFRRVWQMTYGQGQPVDDPGMFPDADLRYEDREGEFDHPGLADAVLDGLKASGGAGEHWSTDYDIASDYGLGYGPAQSGGNARNWRENQQLPVLMDADWNGRGESYSRAGSGNVTDEKEVMLNQGAPLKLRDLRVPLNATDEFSEWNPILPDSRDITAYYLQRMAAEVDDTTDNTCDPSDPSCRSNQSAPAETPVAPATPESAASPAGTNYTAPTKATAPSSGGFAATPSTGGGSSSGGSSAPTSFSPGAGVEQWRKTVEIGLERNGLPSSYADQVLHQMQTESSGNPRAVNNWDSNAQKGTPSGGLLQTIQPTYDSYKLPGAGNDMFNPQDNVDAAINYAKERYGPTLMDERGRGMGSGHGY